MKSIQEVNIGIPRLNLILLVFLTAVMKYYTVTTKAYFLSMFLLGVMIFLSLISTKNIKAKANGYYLFVLASSFVFIIFSGIGHQNFTSFYRNILIIYLVTWYLYLSFMKYGLKYVENMYKQLAMLFNVFSVLNLYQVVFHKPLLLKFLALVQGFEYNFGGSDYRTMSVFGHPIVAGMFFVIAFLCNIYVLKTPFKYILQGILLVNIFSTMSRSAWISIIIVLVLYSVVHIRSIFNKISNFKLTYKKLFSMYIIAALFIIALFFIIPRFNEISTEISLRFGSSLSSNTNDISNLQRTGTVTAILNYMFNSNFVNLLFGYGYGTAKNFMLSHTIILPYFSTTDNQYLTWFYEFGFLGIGTYLTFLFYFIFKLFNKNNHWVQELSILILVCISVSFIFFEGVGWLTVAVMLGITSACLSYKFEKPSLQLKNNEIKSGELSKRVS